MTYQITPDLLERAKKLHQSCFVADAHYDLLKVVCDKRAAGRTNVIATDYLPAIKAGGVNLLICSIYIDDCYIPEMALRQALAQIASLHEEIAESGGALALCRSTAEIRSAVKAGKVAILLSFEGVEPLGCDLRLLRVFYELGVRGVGLVWSRRNYAADGCFFNPVEEGRKGGITHWGVKLLREIERLGMYTDAAHLNDEGFWDLCRLTTRPFMSSHTNCRELTPVMRNMTDDQIRALAERGGVMGMNCCGSFVRDLSTGPANAADLANHGAHVKQAAGAQHLCFGFDFCDEIRAAKGQPAKDCSPYYDSSFELTAQLLARGFSEDELRGVLGENILRFLESVIG